MKLEGISKNWLELQKVSAAYGAKIVLDGVDFEIPPGKIVTVVGANGSGKSTLLKVIGRLLAPHSGCVLLDGKAIDRYDTIELSKQMAILPQLHHASGETTVEELVGFGRFPHRTGLGMQNARDREVIAEALRLTRLEEFRCRKLSTLSGGERQRAWIAMTLTQEPNLLLLDEPTTFLDLRSQFEVIELVRDLNKRFGITVLMVLHDLNLAARCSDLLVTLKDRHIKNIGTPQEILQTEILRDIFEIESEIHFGKDKIPYCVPVGSVKLK
ncbi:MAG: ABC transporter ATP-binding protein [Victivallales bacterium]|jgi:iron complex transport system ATP-binding protein|nr:ABC transporter ATP-binding protein [Victivallales bacterium]